MADLLLYAAIHSQKQLLFPAAAAATTSFTTTNTSETNTTVISPYSIAPFAPFTAPTGPNAWRSALISQWEADIGPYTAPRTNSYCCMDNYSGNYRCGFLGCFCVPPGVSRVTFQLWGAGSGSSQNCCCGGSPAGINGSYAMFQVDVCPGEVFCMCGGCAFCCCGDQDSTPGGSGGTCGTFINYCGNPNGGSVAGGSSTAYTICAPGANLTHICAWNCQMCKVFLGYTTNCNMELPSISSCLQPIGQPNFANITNRAVLTGNVVIPAQGPGFTGPYANCQASTCGSCWSFCWDGSTDDLYVPPIYGCRVPFASTTTSFTAKNAILKGIPTMYPEILVGCSHSDGTTGGFTQPAPVYGFTTPLNGVVTGVPQSAHAMQTYCGNVCGGHCGDSVNAGLCIPGMGAVGSAMYGGNNAASFLGGQGRTGMICISWECA
jgi:hypothetical protein